jgi:hypothetical protein
MLSASQQIFSQFSKQKVNTNILQDEQKQLDIKLNFLFQNVTTFEKSNHGVSTSSDNMSLLSDK